MFGNRRRKKSKLTLDTFTKVWVNRTMYLSWICIFWCFILATMGKEQIAEELGKCIVVNIIGVFIGYLTKSFFETREEKRLETTKQDINPETNSTEKSYEEINEEEFIDA